MYTYKTHIYIDKKEGSIFLNLLDPVVLHILETI